MENTVMTKEGQVSIMIDAFTNLQRIEKSEDRDKEIRNQKIALTAKLEAMGVVVENLILE
ncbi:MAG: hypothetical protein J6O55_08280 [Lachnospiraceae bacterium]|nr:hypothetical protein [Lachnospiraceae bacterium]